ncbi:Uncharacterized protein APZ42_012639 [Daphnia magna]|uniref:Uncharacterized protein n=1 Tax=Daphnia magna TaxID=35525 RepID=A0A162RLW1_9CRUS|nr:Uncharacterized protein APZ42_012639 [Daphnia magna]
MANRNENCMHSTTSLPHVGIIMATCPSGRSNHCLSYNRLILRRAITCKGRGQWRLIRTLQLQMLHFSSNHQQPHSPPRPIFLETHVKRRWEHVISYVVATQVEDRIIYNKQETIVKAMTAKHANIVDKPITWNLNAVLNSDMKGQRKKWQI